MLSGVLLYNPMNMCAHGAMVEEVVIHFVVMVFFNGFIPKIAQYVTPVDMHANMSICVEEKIPHPYSNYYLHRPPPRRLHKGHGSIHGRERVLLTYLYVSKRLNSSLGLTHCFTAGKNCTGPSELLHTLWKASVEPGNRPDTIGKTYR